MESPNGLVAALARCQLAFPPIVKSHTNPAFKGSQYADVADVLAAVRPVLAAEGIAIIQPLEYSAAGTFLITKLLFGDEEIKSEVVLPDPGNPQQFGSLLTYMRRYCLCALLGVHPVGDDDDGNLAATAQQTQREPEASAEARERTLTAIKVLTEQEQSAVADWLRNNKVPSLKRAGATLTQLNELEDFIAQLGTEPFDLDPPPDPLHAPPTPPGPPHKGFKPKSDDVPFNPVVAVGAADESGSRRAARNSATRAP